MKLYLKILVLNIAAVILLNYIYCRLNGASFWLSALYLLISVSFCGVSCGIISLVSRKLPKKWFAYDNKRFRIFSFEQELYEKLAIKKWKDKIPELGCLCGFKKNKIYEPRNPEYLHKFLEENCIAEWLHFESILCGVIIFFIVPANFLMTVTIPVFLLNAMLHTLPVVVQRYLRPKLFRIYELTLKNTKQAAVLKNAGSDKYGRLENIKMRQRQNSYVKEPLNVWPPYQTAITGKISTAKTAFLSGYVFKKY